MIHKTDFMWRGRLDGFRRGNEKVVSGSTQVSDLQRTTNVEIPSSQRVEPNPDDKPDCITKTKHPMLSKVPLGFVAAHANGPAAVNGANLGICAWRLRFHWPRFNGIRNQGK